MINYASKYDAKVDEKFKLGSMTANAVNTEYDFTGVDTVNVYTIPTSAMNDYSLTGNARYGTAEELQNSVQSMKLGQDRSFTFTIDRRSFTDTQMAMEAGKALARQLDEVCIPEVDVYRLAKIVAGAKNSATLAITKENAYESFLDAQSALTDEKAPLNGRVCYCTPSFYKNIKLDGAFVKASDLAQEMLIKGQLGAIDGVAIVVVPTSYLPSKVEFVITHASATVGAQKIADYKIHDNPPGVSGWLVEGRMYYDAFVLDNKKGAIFVHKNA